jgi:large exoprotein involved in heme utilization and adhesion
LISGATISQVGNLIVSGLTTLTAGTGDINFTLTGNDFNRVTVNSGNLVSLQDQNALTLGPVKVTAGLLANAVGQLTTATISTPGGFITLQGQSNIDTTAGTLSTSDLLSSGGNIRIEAAGSVNLGNLTTIGQNSASGDITVISQNGSITATGRRIESQSNSVGLGGTGGDITLTGQSINLTDTTLRSSTSGQNDAGSIALSATEAIDLLQGTQLVANTSGAGNAGQIRLSGNSLQIAGESSGRISSISSNVEVGSQGNSGGILANVTGAIQILGGGQLSADTFGQGNAGVIDITTGSLKLQGASNTGIHSSIFSRVNNSGTGDSGGIKITASDQIEILDGALISASTFGQGNAGVVNLSANRLLLQGESPSGLTSGIFSRAVGTSGSSGGIVVNATESIELLEGSQFDASSLGVGDAGIIDLTTKTFRIQGESTRGSISSIISDVKNTAIGNSGGIRIQAADSIEILDGALLSASTFGKGNAGTINLQTANFWAQGDDSAGLGGLISSIVGTDGIGNSGGIVINASDRMELRDGATLTSSTSGQGNAGQISLTAADIVIEGEDSDRNVTSLNSEVERPGRGDSGGITLNASNSIKLIDGVFLTSTTLGQGNAGRIQLTAPNIIAEGQNSNGEGVNIFSQVDFLDQSLVRLLFDLPLAEGSAGGISITASDSLQLLDGATLSSGTFGNGDAGTVEVTANTIVLQGEGQSFFADIIPESVNPGGIGNLVGYGAVGNSGTIKLSTGSLSVLDGATISSSTLGNGEAGLIDIQARESVKIEGKGELSGFASRIISTVEPGANGGSQGIQINTALLSLDDGSSISASNGNTLDDLGLSVIVDFLDDLGLSTIVDTLDDLGLSTIVDILDDLGLSTIVDFLDLNGLIDQGQGDAGSIILNTTQLNVANGSVISSSTNGQGNAGTVTINSTESILLNQGTISTAIEAQGVADRPSNIIINTGIFDLIDGSLISASTAGQGDAGAVRINVTDSMTLQGQTATGVGNQILSQVEQNATGNANEISISTPQLTLRDGAVIAADTTGAGNASSIRVQASDFINLGENTRLSVETSSSGTPGDIEVTTPRLSIGQNAQLSATVTATSTNTEGGGNIALNVSDLDITGRLGIFAETNSLAQAGNLVIQPNGTDPNLDITFTNNGFISASTTASGDGGSISLSAPAAIDIRGEGSIAVTTSGSGAAGNIQFTTPQLNLSDGVTITGSTTGTGTGGTISVRTADRFTLTNARLETLTEGSGDAGNINLELGRSFLVSGENAGIFVTSAENATGNSGRITLQQLDGISNALNVELTQGATLSASTSGQANAGSIQLQDIDTLRLDGGIISTEITETGQSTEQSNIEIEAETLTLDNGSAITADTQGIGDAGNIDLSTVETLTIAGDSRISSSTSGQGNSGTIDLTGTQTITGTGGTISTAVLAGGQGQGGSITIATDTLDLTNTDITSSTAGKGDTGTIAITARQGATLEQNSEISTAVESGATGNAQQIDLFTPQLSLNQSQITASTSGTGNAGRINLTGIDGVSTQQIGLNNNSAITTAVNTGAIGNAGQITLETRQLNLTTGSQIASSSDGQGRAGRITAQNVDSITLDNSTISTEIAENGTAETINESDRGNIILSTQLLSLDNGSTITARTAGFRDPGFNDAGQIDLTTATTTLNNGSAVQTNTAGSGTAGNINLIATEGLFLSDPNSGIFSSTEEGSTGNAGNITIDPPIVDIRDGAGVAVNSFGSGLGGNITLFAGNLNLTNNAFISALTRSSGGGNINLIIDNNLILQNSSFISTEAGTAQAGGDGGNITLSNFFTIGRNNSDIIANAFEGNGGSINITTQGLFGFIVKNVDNPREDLRNNITASSRFGSSGTTNISATVDPAQGLLALPGNLVDPSSLIDRRCDLAYAPNASRFVILGKGGLPATARDLLSHAPLLTDLDLANPISLDRSVPASIQTFAPTTDEFRSSLTPKDPLHISRAIGLNQFLSNRCSN